MRRGLYTGNIVRQSGYAGSDPIIALTIGGVLVVQGKVFPMPMIPLMVGPFELWYLDCDECDGCLAWRRVSEIAQTLCPWSAPRTFRRL